MRVVSRLWENFKHANICIIGVPEGEEKKKDIGNLFEKIMKENILNLVREIYIYIHTQVPEVQRVPKKMDPKRPTPRHIIIKMPKLNTKRES